MLRRVGVRAITGKGAKETGGRTGEVRRFKLLHLISNQVWRRGVLHEKWDFFACLEQRCDARKEEKEGSRKKEKGVQIRKRTVG